MPVDVYREMAALEAMTVPELRARYADVCGHSTRGRNRRSLIRRIVWRLQALAEGDLSERAQQRAEELANDADLRLHPPQKAPPPATMSGSSAMTEQRPDDPAEERPPVGMRKRQSALPAPGTVLTRVYKRRLIEVTVLADGVDYQGVQFATLSAVAKHVTGSHWNGFHFFGLTQKENKKK